MLSHGRQSGGEGGCPQREGKGRAKEVEHGVVDRVLGNFAEGFHSAEAALHSVERWREDMAVSCWVGCCGVQTDDSGDERGV